jgi:gliding motility-associated-like protein
VSFGQKTNSGTEFWMGFMENYVTSGHSLRLYISSSFTSKVTIKIPRLNYTDTLTIPKDSVRIAYIPPNYGENLLYDSIDERGIHIVSDYPITVSAMNLSAATTDASIVLPLVNIPFNATYTVGNPNPSTNQILLVASSDSTVVSITPVTSLSKNTKRPTTGTYTIKLQRGQSYQTGSTTNLSGSVIKVLSKSKVAVYSGDRCSNFPCGACDHQYEQVLPTDVLDTAYCAAPHFGHTNGYYLKLIPLDTFTNLKVNGVSYNNVSRKSPLVINVKGDSGYYVSGNKLFHCYQFLKGGGCNGYITSSYGDPAMLDVISTKHLGQSVLFSTVNSTNLRDHFVSIVIKTSAKDNVYHNKTKIDSSEFKPFPYARSYSYAELKINDGVHLLESNDGLLAYSYGIGFYESYLYLAGFNLPNFDLDFADSVLQYDCKNQKIKMQFRAKSSTTLKKYTWYFGDNTTGTGNPISHVYNNVGNYTVKLVGEDFSGKKDSVTRKIKVNWPDFDPVRNKIICGMDTVTFIEKNPFFANFKWQDSSTNRFLKVWTNKNVWVKATDTSGYCHFVDTGVVAKIDILSNLRVDSLDKCFKMNTFRFRDSSKVFADQIDHKAWVFNFKTYWDTDDITVRFPMPGKYKVYFDVYTKVANCKARYPIDVTVHPSPKAFAKSKGEDFCSNRPFFLYDSSKIVTGRIAKVKWLFDDSTSITSDSNKTFAILNYNKTKGDIIRFYKHIAISDNECTDTTLYAVKVWPKPTVNFTLSPNDTIKCLPNARWTYTSTTQIDVDTFDLFWDAGNGSKGTSFNLRNVRYNSPGKYPVKLLARSTYGCTDSLIRTIEVLPKPIAQFRILDSAQCLNNNAFVVKDSSIGNYLKYHWTYDQNSSDTGKSPKAKSFSTFGLHSIQLNISSPIAGCNDSVKKWVTVQKPPTLAFNINNDTQCLIGNQFTLTNNSSVYQGLLSTDWYSNTLLIGNSSTINNFKYNASGSYTIKLIVTDSAQCKDSLTQVIRVNDKAITGIAINDSIQCIGKARFVLKTTNPGIDRKAFRVDGNLTQNGFIDSLVVVGLSAGKHTISILQTTVNGCQDSARGFVYVLNPPKAQLSINQDSQCINQQRFVLYNQSSQGIDPLQNISFTCNQLNYLSKDSVVLPNFVSSGKYPVKLVIKSLEQCEDSTSADITVLDLPVAQIIGDTICLYENAQLRAQPLKGNIQSWQWQLGDGNTSSIQNPVHAYNSTGWFNVQLNYQDQYACKNLTSLNNAVLVRGLPNAQFTYTATDVGINQIQLYFNANQKGYPNYFWTYPNNFSSNKDTHTLVIGERLKGYTRLIVKDGFGCIDSSSQYLDLFPNNFNVYVPNAISLNKDGLNDVFKVFGIGEVLNFKMFIYNRWGETIYIGNDAKSGWDGSYQNEMVPEGVYAYWIEFSYFDQKTYSFRGTITVIK